MNETPQFEVCFFFSFFKLSSLFLWMIVAVGICFGFGMDFFCLLVMVFFLSLLREAGERLCELIFFFLLQNFFQNFLALYVYASLFIHVKSLIVKNILLHCKSEPCGSYKRGVMSMISSFYANRFITVF